jgi:hypothetical protein
MKENGISNEQVFDSCAVLDHYHRKHTTEKVTRFRNRDGADIYVVSDLEWKARLRTFVSPIFQVEVTPNGK